MVNLDETWLENNTRFPHPQWYINNLELQRVGTKGKGPWLDLPVGSLSDLCTTATQSSPKSSTTQKYDIQTELSLAYQFKYL